MSNKAQEKENHYYEVEVIQTRIVKYILSAKSLDEVEEKVFSEDFFETEESTNEDIIEEKNESIASIFYLD